MTFCRAEIVGVRPPACSAQGGEQHDEKKDSRDVGLGLVALGFKKRIQAGERFIPQRVHGRLSRDRLNRVGLIGTGLIGINRSRTIWIRCRASVGADFRTSIGPSFGLGFERSSAQSAIAEVGGIDFTAFRADHETFSTSTFLQFNPRQRCQHWFILKCEGTIYTHAESR